jgi:hypothetical protein
MPGLALRAPGSMPAAPVLIRMHRAAESVRSTAFVIIRLEGDARPDDVTAERVVLDT